MLSKENRIENAVMRNAAQLGYPSAYAIRNCRIGPEQGQVDLALFPRMGKKKVILVEAKQSSAVDAKCKVVGQLIMYLTGALQLSHEGIKLYRDYARKQKKAAWSVNKTTAKQIAGARTAEEAWDIVRDGTPVERDQIALYVATDGAPSNQILRAIELLAEHHNLQIGLIQVTGNKIKVIRPCP